MTLAGAAPLHGYMVILNACLCVGVPHVGVKDLISLKRGKNKDAGPKFCPNFEEHMSTPGLKFSVVL